MFQKAKRLMKKLASAKEKMQMFRQQLHESQRNWEIADAFL